jgi:hypothetical protein
MATEKDFELLDDYLSNRLSENDRSAFDKKIEADPALKRELEFQQQMAKGLKKARVAELKAMLNAVPVTSAVSTGSNGLMKAASWVAATVIVGATVYYLTRSQEKTESTTPVTDSVLKQEPTTPPQEEPSNSAVEPTVKEEKETPVVEKPIATKKQKLSAGKSAPVDPKIEVFDPSLESEEQSSEPAKEILAEDSNVTETKSNTIAVSIDSNNRKYNFHYKLVNDQLTLYGPFETNLYEILEFISDDKRTAFLYYKNTFYYIKEVEKATELVPVKDPALINKIRKLQ